MAERCIAFRERRTAELPTPRARKALPERSARFLVVRDAQGRVLLERRPPAGIWGGLQCLPELPDDAEAVTWVAQRLGLHTNAVSPALTLRHSFSHFHLLMTPLLCTVTQASGEGVLMEPGWDWLTTDELVAAALPAPVRTILQREGVISGR